MSGRNFGCGSSREHAPQSLYYAGFRAILAESFAEIFFGNATTLGLPCIRLRREDREALASLVGERPEQEMEIDLTTKDGPTVRFSNRAFRGELPETTRKSLVEGQWDPLGSLLDARDEASRLAARLPKPAVPR